MTRLDSENLAFASTFGVSAVNRNYDFVPAFRNDRTGEIRRSRFLNGQPAPIHVVDGLPADWKFEPEFAHGSRTHVTSGFIRHGRFFTREEAAACTQPHLHDTRVAHSKTYV